MYNRTWHSQNKLKRNGSFLGLIYNETWYSQNRLKRNSSLSGLNITRLVAFRKVVQSVTEGKNENKRNIYYRPIVKKINEYSEKGNFCKKSGITVNAFKINFKARLTIHSMLILWKLVCLLYAVLGVLNRISDNENNFFAWQDKKEEISVKNQTSP